MRDTLDTSHAEPHARVVVQEPGAAADLRAATRHYERHVIAWYALGRVWELRAARAAIARCREELAAPLHGPASRPPRPLTT